jgi:hypothetical protein
LRGLAFAYTTGRLRTERLAAIESLAEQLAQVRWFGSVVASPFVSTFRKNARLNHPVKVCLDLGGKIAARDQQAKLHVQREGILSEVGA